MLMFCSVWFVLFRLQKASSAATWPSWNIMSKIRSSSGFSNPQQPSTAQAPCPDCTFDNRRSKPDQKSPSECRCSRRKTSSAWSQNWPKFGTHPNHSLYSLIQILWQTATVPGRRSAPHVPESATNRHWSLHHRHSLLLIFWNRPKCTWPKWSSKEHKSVQLSTSIQGLSISRERHANTLHFTRTASLPVRLSPLCFTPHCSWPNCICSLNGKQSSWNYNHNYQVLSTRSSVEQDFHPQFSCAALALAVLIPEEYCSQRIRVFSKEHHGDILNLWGQLRTWWYVACPTPLAGFHGFPDC